MKNKVCWIAIQHTFSCSPLTGLRSTEADSSHGTWLVNVSGKTKYPSFQHRVSTCVWRSSRQKQQPPADSVNIERKYLVQSGKVTLPHCPWFLFMKINIFLHEKKCFFSWKEMFLTMYITHNKNFVEWENTAGNINHPSAFSIGWRESCNKKTP